MALPPVTTSGIVDGTEQDDLIDIAYRGDPEDDRIDHGDAILPGHGPQDDEVWAYEGNDTVYARDGNDTVYGGDGNDQLFGQDGDDRLEGQAGNDYLQGGLGNDTILGGAGNDTIVGSEGADSINAGDGRDIIVGVHPGDYVDGGSGGDDYDALDLRGSGRFRIDYDPTNSENGTVTFLDPTSGASIGTMEFRDIELIIPCFTPGARIATPRGEVLVENLQPGDKVITRDNGIQEIRWVGRRTLSHPELRQAPQLRPVLIKAGALGNGLPARDMLVSPQHRMLIAGDRSSLYFEESEVLVAAKHMINHKDIHYMDTLRTTYIHFMFDRHEVVLADGAWTESFQPGDQSLGAMGHAQRDEILAIFPELRDAVGIENYAAARRVLKSHEARLIMH